jgi:hypothetical protein
MYKLINNRIKRLNLSSPKDNQYYKKPSKINQKEHNAYYKKD